MIRHKSLAEFIIKELEDKDVRVVGKMLDHYTQIGEDNVHTPYSFIHPKDIFGIMVELAIR